MKTIEEITKELKKPFPEKNIQWRIARAGTNKKGIFAQVLAYIDARAVQDRLDSILGIDNWQDDYAKGPDGGVQCKLSIKINGEWITKQDGAENTNIDAVKGGYSGAFKRAAVKWGIGRYLYHLGQSWAVICNNGVNYQGKAFNKDRSVKHEAFNWNAPRLPAWALPKNNIENKLEAKTNELDELTKQNIENVKTTFDGEIKESVKFLISEIHDLINENDYRNKANEEQKIKISLFDRICDGIQKGIKPTDKTYKSLNNIKEVLK